MAGERFPWLRETCHHPDPHAWSITRPLTITVEEDADLEWTPPGQDAPATLHTKRYDFLFPYRNYKREARIGRGRMWLPPGATGEPRSTPMVLSIHYEAGEDMAKGLLGRGIGLITPIALSEDHGFNLVGDGMDHTIAMAQLVRRLPFVDLQRIGWTGGSAGGYQCLMTLEAVWPVACAEANVPLSDLTYNLEHIRHANRYNAGITDPIAMPVPIVWFVREIYRGTVEALDNDLDKAWQHSAPPGAALIRSPALIHTVTGDLLCPSAQIGREFYRPAPRGTFPSGWNMDYDKFCNPNSNGKRLLEWFRPQDYETFCVAIPEWTKEIDAIPADMYKGDIPPEPEDAPTAFHAPKPFSREKLISVVVQDEGPPKPRSGHARYHVGLDNTRFFDFHLARGYVPPEHLTPLVLTRVLGRFSKDVPQNPSLPELRRMHPVFDKWEALLALETFMGGPERHENVEVLTRTYSELPPVARALDVERDGVSASFAAEPQAAILYHKARVLREVKEEDAAKKADAELLEAYPDSAWAKLAAAEKAAAEKAE